MRIVRDKGLASTAPTKEQAILIVQLYEGPPPLPGTWYLCVRERHVELYREGDVDVNEVRRQLAMYRHTEHGVRKSGRGNNAVTSINFRTS
jgi:hypothetical protein